MIIDCQHPQGLEGPQFAFEHLCHLHSLGSVCSRRLRLIFWLRKHKYLGDLRKKEEGSPKDLSDILLAFPIQVFGVGREKVVGVIDMRSGPRSAPLMCFLGT